MNKSYSPGVVAAVCLLIGAAAGYVLRLRRAAVGAVVHVAVGLRVRRAVGGEGETGGSEGAGHPLL